MSYLLFHLYGVVYSSRHYLITVHTREDLIHSSYGVINNVDTKAKCRLLKINLLRDYIDNATVVS
jgi:hypothetical protein